MTEERTLNVAGSLGLCRDRSSTAKEMLEGGSIDHPIDGHPADPALLLLGKARRQARHAAYDEKKSSTHSIRDSRSPRSRPS